MNISSIGIEQGHSWSNWNIAYTYDQLGKSKALKESMGYNKIAQQIKKFGKTCAKHISKFNLARSM